MTLSEFEIGLEFWSGDRLWRCTDKGARVITAICIHGVTVTQNNGPETTSRWLDRYEAAEEGWFSGPPYAVAEMVFDENDIEGCTPARDESSLAPASDT
jgi:hypothetical protein